MFSIGQKVWHRDGRRSGKVLEVDGDQVFIEQENGAELQLRASDLTAVPPAAADRHGAATAAAAAYAMPDRTLLASDITPEHLRVLALVPVRTVQAVAALYEKRNRGRKFAALDAAGKLNVIAQVTAVPYRTMRAYSDRPGEMGLLMGKGLADSQKAG
jgi:hypothetical protein